MKEDNLYDQLNESDTFVYHKLSKDCERLYYHPYLEFDEKGNPRVKEIKRYGGTDETRYKQTTCNGS